MPFEDIEASRTIIAGILRHGLDAFIDVDGLVDPDMLADETHKVILTCAREHFGARGEKRKLDHTTLYSVARSLKLSHVLEDEEEKRHVRGLMNYGNGVDLASVAPAAGKILKLHVGREFDDLLRRSRLDLQKMTGDEKLGMIMAMAEGRVMEYAQSLSDGKLNAPTQIAEEADAWLEDVLENPRENIGIPLPWAKWNEQVGGGPRAGGVTVIAARPKSGKSSLANAACLFVAKNGTPVFNVDTEMSMEEQMARVLAHETGIPINDIERGFVTPEQKETLRTALAEVKKLPYHYKSVVDLSFDEQLAAMRRWIIRNVPVDDEGQRQPALIVYDYLQISDASEFKGDFKEYQMLGFQMMALIRLASKYKVAVLSFLQLNREGDSKVSTTVAAGSDRIIWKCASFSILRLKDETDLENDGEENGSRMLINLIARHGPGGNGNYISLHFDGARARITEGKTFAQLRKERGAIVSEERVFPEGGKKHGVRKKAPGGGKKKPETATVEALTENATSDPSLF